MLTVGEWAEGSLWPEPVEIKRCDPLGDQYYRVEALGQHTRTYFESVFDVYQLETVRHGQTAAIMEDYNPEWWWQAAQGQILAADRRFSRVRSRGNHQVLPLPHQVEAVYGRLLQAPLVRFLLADDPGAGKTIMAGMLIRELRVRGLADRVLILVPPLVLTQWQEELRQKFGEEFRIIARGNGDGRGNPFAEAPHCLTSMYWAARPEIQALVTQPPWDLVIVDEAHKMAAYTQGKKTPKIARTQLYRLGEALLPETPQCLLLTATPHKGDPENFRHLMRLVDPDVFAQVDPAEVMRERANPYIIRRLKESMVNFDGTPIFPPRTTKTVEFALSPGELALYDAVTRYVQDHFNQAVQHQNGGAAFAMMLLQRRLSSSLEAITRSLIRRRERLQILLTETLRDRKHWQDQWARLHETEDTAGEGEDTATEEEIVGAVDTVDPDALEEEMVTLDPLIQMAEDLRRTEVERKYQELEAALWGPGGLLAQGEKLLIFTESRDTLRYLTQRLTEKLGEDEVATIAGDHGMEQRQNQVEHFRRQAVVMIATDAGGESINLQFCNQMVNYDIPWNPNRLEQRMGRIHRIGQTREVFVFNMVAVNTREGDVMRHLLRKMAQMEQDLGPELVYNILGDILAGPYGSLADIMAACITGRTTLDAMIANLERTLSQEHQRLLDLAAQEQIDGDTVDLPRVRAQQQRDWVEHVPDRLYEQFTRRVFKTQGVSLTQSQGHWVLGRIPRVLRDRWPHAVKWDASRISVGDNPIDRDSPLYLMAEHWALQANIRSGTPVIVPYPTPEPLDMVAFQIGIGDGSGQEVYTSLVHWARRRPGGWIAVDSYWCFDERLANGRLDDQPLDMTVFDAQALGTTIRERNRIRQVRDSMVDKKSQYLRRAFDQQYHQLLDRLNGYQRTNVDNRNSALINRTTVRIRELESRRQVRMDRLERERAIQMRPPQAVFAVRLVPWDMSRRIIPQDWEPVVQTYLLLKGYQNVLTLPAFGLVDFYAETLTGEPVYILGTTESTMRLSDGHQQDLKTLGGRVLVCQVAPDAVVGSWVW